VVRVGRGSEVSARLLGKGDILTQVLHHCSVSNIMIDGWDDNNIMIVVYYLGKQY
jgi:hypothetical protein